MRGFSMKREIDGLLRCERGAVVVRILSDASGHVERVSRFCRSLYGSELAGDQRVPALVPLIVISLLMAPLTDGIVRADIGLRNLLTFPLSIPLAILIGTSWDLSGVCIVLIIDSIVGKCRANKSTDES
jgi:hypothetical protein